jgi:hemerythrin-like domain-containing protein
MLTARTTARKRIFCSGTCKTKSCRLKTGGSWTELIEEHVFGRTTTRALVAANHRYRQGDVSALENVIRCLRTLVDFYPGHIEKEDKVFFPASRAYFTEAEEQAMLAEFREFDRQMIHEKYTLVVEGLEERGEF